MPSKNLENPSKSASAANMRRREFMTTDIRAYPRKPMAKSLA
jgi:hypothetical protein